MSDSASASDHTEQPGVDGQQTGQPDWAAERAKYERKISELSERDTRQQQVIAGSQREFGVLREHGFESVSDLVPHLGTIKGLVDSGIDPEQFSRAFKPQKTEQEVTGIDMESLEKSLEDKLFKRIGERQSIAQRESAIRSTFTGVNKMVDAELKDATDKERKLARGFVRDELMERLSTDSEADPSSVLKDIWAEYQSLAGDDSARADGQRMRQIADQVTTPKRGDVPRSESGGMGKPDESETTDQVRSRREAALARKYQQRRKTAMSGSE